MEVRKKDGAPIACPSPPDHRTRITLRRTLKPGEQVEAPPGCTLAMQVEAEEKP